MRNLYFSRTFKNLFAVERRKPPTVELFLQCLKCWERKPIRYEMIHEKSAICDINYFCGLWFLFCGLISHLTGCGTSPGGVLGYISDGDVRRPFLGLKFSAWDFFGFEIFWWIFLSLGSLPKVL